MKNRDKVSISDKSDIPRVADIKNKLPDAMQFLAYPEYLCRKWYWLWKTFAFIRLPIEFIAATAIVTGIITFYYSQKDRADQTAIQQAMLMAEVGKLASLGYDAGSPTIAFIMTLLNKQGASMQYVQITDMTLPERIQLSNAKLSDASFFGTTLLNANLSKANLSNATFRGANVSEGDFSEANLTRSNWLGSNLTKVNFSHANLLYADLRQTRVDHANFTDSDIAGANFQNSTISQLQVDQACQRPAGPPPILPQHLRWQNNICD